ncbi:MAG: hypothetical protein H6745_19755 [Deltaproteobacteria bacterium]|nr:hypothetical protein [Deltaproteobacteria bacterium]
MNAATSATLEAARAGLASAAARGMEDVLGGLTLGGDRAVGSAVRLRGVDPTRQRGEGDARAIVHEEDGAIWVLALDAGARRLVEQLRSVQTTFGLARDARWEVVGKVLGVEAREDEGEGDAAAADAGPPAVLVSLKAVYVPGQVALFGGTPKPVTVPGLAEAEQRLAELHAGQVAPAARTPEELLPALAQALDTHHFALFERLWVAGERAADLQNRFRHFREAFAVAKDGLAAERCEPPVDPMRCADGDEARLFVRRTMADDEVIVRPLVCRREKGVWRLAAGIL